MNKQQINIERKDKGFESCNAKGYCKLLHIKFNISFMILFKVLLNSNFTTPLFDFIFFYFMFFCSLWNIVYVFMSLCLRDSNNKIVKSAFKSKVNVALCYSEW